MRIKLQSGVWVGALGFAFSGVFVALSATPGQNALLFTGWLSIAAGILLAIWGIKVDDEHWWTRRQLRMTWPYALMMLSLIGFVTGAAFAWRKPPTSPAAMGPITPTPRELHKHFETDFAAHSSGGVGTMLNGYSLIPLGDGKDLKLEWKVLTDFGSHSRFMVYYIPDSKVAAIDVAKFIGENFRLQLDAFTSEVRSSIAESATNSSTLPINKIFIYHEKDISDADKSNLAKLYRAHGIEVEFRSRSYPLRLFDAQQLSELRALRKRAIEGAKSR